MGGIGTATGVRASILALVALLSGSGFAEAAPDATGWTSEPVAPVEGSVEEAERLCLPLEPPVDSSGATVALVDQRGPDGVMVMWELPSGGISECLVIRDSAGSHVVDRPTAWNELLEPEEVTAFDVMEISPLGVAPRRVLGWVPLPTTEVMIDLDDGTRLSGSVADGRFIAWWPTASMIREITARDATGAIVARAGPAPFYAGLPLPPGDPYEDAARHIEQVGDPAIERVAVERSGGITNLVVHLVDGATEEDANRVWLDVIGCDLARSELLIAVVSGDNVFWGDPCVLL